MSPARRSLLLASALIFFTGGCKPPERAPGERAPLSAMCDDTSATRCLLPWPSNVYTVKDASTETGLRLDVKQDGLYVRDDLGAFNLADGFSRSSSLLAGFPTPVGDPSGAVHLFLAEPTHPDFGARVPLWTHVEEEDGESLVGANPYAPLEANADYVAVITDALRAADGTALEPSRRTLLALGRAEAEDEDEERIIAYHAPTRAVLDAAGVDVEDVLVVWDFTTRSSNDAPKILSEMLAIAEAAVDNGNTSVSFETIEVPGTDVALKVIGQLHGVPSFRNEDGTLALGEDGLPRVTGQTSALFRMVIPAGDGAYRIVMYGHGTGGTHDDDTLDSEVVAADAAKVGFPFQGWTGSEVANTWFGFESMFLGVHKSTAGLAQSLANAAAIQRALATVLGDALSTGVLTDVNGNVVDNPAAGRRPDLDAPMWAGGSLGGTMGLAYASAHPDIHHGVLNVPGAGWTQWIHIAETYGLIRLLLHDHYGGALNLIHSAKMAQLNWDPIDGASFVDLWREKGGTFLVQSSMGDPVLPNPGSHTVALCADAVQVGAVLEAVPGISPGEAAGKSGFTQFKVPDSWGDLERHGFATRDFVASAAAREQIRHYIRSVWEGAPEVILPPQCVDNGGSCDFSDVE